MNRLFFPCLIMCMGATPTASVPSWIPTTASTPLFHPRATGLPPFRVIELGLLKGTYRAAALNRHRQVAGHIFPDTLFVWDAGKLSTLVLPGMLVEARAITDTGMVLGAAHDPGAGVTRAVLWVPATGMMNILDPGIDLWPNDVNRDELGVGLGDGNREGFALDSTTGVYTPLLFGAPPQQGVGSAGATAVNVHGVAVGSEVVFETHPNFPNDPPVWWEKPFLWSEPSGMVELAVDLIGNTGRANDINKKGLIVGYFIDAFGTMRPALWRNSGATLNDLGLPPTYPVAEATNVNALGQVLVSAPNDIWGFTRIFLWDKGTYLDLTASLPAAAAWDVWIGADINDRGEILAGVIPEGAQSPPEPLQWVVLVPNPKPIR